jgi:hypothetical protein
MGKESSIEAVKFGSMFSSLAVSKCVSSSQTCKEMLLNARNSMEGYCQHLKLNIDDTPVQYFVCEKWVILFVLFKRERYDMSAIRNQKCKSGKLTNVSG